MEVNGISGVNTPQDVVKLSTTPKKPVVEPKKEEVAIYEKSSKAPKSYKIVKMSKEDRAAIVEKMKEDQKARQKQLMDLVSKMLTGQGKAISIANNDDSLWKILAKGDFTVDALTKKQAQEDISEDGYWGVKQTSQRMFDFALALSGGDKEKMKEMKSAMEKGYKQATAAWGKELPDITKKTMEAANKLFDDYFKSDTAKSVSDQKAMKENAETAMKAQASATRLGE